MRYMIAASSALALVAAMPVLAQGHGQGQGQGKGKGAANAAVNSVQMGKPDKAGDKGNGKAKGQAMRAEKAPQQRGESDQAKGPPAAPPGKLRGQERAAEARAAQAGRLDDPADLAGRDRDFDPETRFRGRGKGLIDGCPPGLAKKNNGCMPPGQARKITRNDNFARYLGLGDGEYRLADGNLYRIAGSGVAGYMPLLGGTLFGGNRWPEAYAGQAAPDYYRRLYGANDDYAYRYADNAIFRVDPEREAIMGVAALLTGDDWQVGQPMPTGYDVYNVPPAYRTMYPRTADSMYRYSDGYVYEVDPETRLVAAAIELLG